MVSRRVLTSSDPGSHQNVRVSQRIEVSWTGRVLAFAAALFVVLVGWAISTPVGSSPDDDYHLSSTWCALGEREGVCEQDPADVGARLVPENVARAYACYSFRSDVDASCADVLTDVVMVSTTRVNETAGQYPGGFYEVMGVFVGTDTDRSVLLMRLFNAGVAVLLLVGGLLLAPRGIARSAAAATMIVYVPIGLFIVPSTNPSSWAITGIASLWIFGLSLMLTDTWRQGRTWLLAAGATVGALMAMSARLDAAVYVGITVAVIAVIVGWRAVLRQWKGAALLGVLSLAGLWVFITTDPPVSPGGEALGTSERGIGLFLTNLVNAPVYLQQVVGGPLGWYDVNLPTWVPIIGTLVLGMVVYRRLAKGPSRVLAASALAFAAVLAVPIAFLQLGGLVVGELVQPRYFLPLMVVFVATAGLNVRVSRRYPWPRSATIVVVPLLALSAVLSYWYTAHRYAAGSTKGLFDRDLVIGWGGLTGLPWGAVVVVTVLATVTMYLVGSSFLSTQRKGRRR